VLHLLNGDATAAVFPDALGGERAVWRDILMEGPAVADAATRAAWLAPRLGVSVEAYERGWHEGEAVVARARDHDEVVVWVERDLFCTINLWFVLDRLGARRVSLVYPGVTHDAPGLSRRGPAEFSKLFEERAPLSAETIGEARALWRAYAAPQPTTLASLEPVLPFARAAIRLHCGRFPSVATGLNEIEADTLAALEGTRDFPDVFRAVMASLPRRQLGMGDRQLAALLRDLAAGPMPLVVIERRDEPLARWRISRTAAAAEVVAGRVDRLALVALDRWLGGVHLRPGAPLWRWDEARLALVAA